MMRAIFRRGGMVLEGLTVDCKLERRRDLVEIVGGGEPTVGRGGLGMKQARMLVEGAFVRVEDVVGVWMREGCSPVVKPWREQTRSRD